VAAQDPEARSGARAGAGLTGMKGVLARLPLPTRETIPDEVAPHVVQNGRVGDVDIPKGQLLAQRLHVPLQPLLALLHSRSNSGRTLGCNRFHLDRDGSRRPNDVFRLSHVLLGIGTHAGCGQDDLLNGDRA
jgi:hypothetical protein